MKESMIRMISTFKFTNDWKICAVIFVISLAIRLPYLYDVPRFIDEWREINLSAEIARGESWPLHNTSHDIGPFHNYILAGLFTIFGFHLEIPRLYVAILSAATVVLTYWIARHWTSVGPALFAAMLMATNSMHILVTHMAWSNDTTPFFLALAVLLTLKSIEKENHRFWAMSGLAWAVALQTHPSVIAAMVGVVWFFARTYGLKSFFNDSRFLTAIGVFLAGYSNMIIHNILTPLDSILWIKRKDYALNQELSLDIYLTNIQQMGSELIHSLSSTFPNESGWSHQLSFFLMLIFACALIYGFRKVTELPSGNLLTAIVLSSMLIIPLINQRYVYYVSTRYIAYLFPICLIIISIGFSHWLKALLPMASRWQRILWKPSVAIFCLVSGIIPLYHFYSYAESYISSGQDNSAEYSTVEKLLTKNTKSFPIIVDKQAKQAEAVSKMFRVKGITSRLAGIDPQEVQTVQALKRSHTESLSFNRVKWEQVLTQNKPYTWYVLSHETVNKLNEVFDINWINVEKIKARNGKDIYFTGQIISFTPKML